MKDKDLQPFEIKFTGRCRPADDPAVIGTDFRTLKNMRYTDTHVKGVAGMTKINTTAPTNKKFRAAHHYTKYQPAESHLIVQAYNAGETTSTVYENTTAIPSAGDFSATALWTDSSGASKGHFSDAPDGSVAYCNGVDTCIWGGTEFRVAAFLNNSTSGSFEYDYTDVVNNTLTDSENIATLHRQTSTGDANTMLLLHLENNVTDSSPTTAHTVTNTNVTYSSTDKKVGSYSAVFNGTNAYLSAPDDADFDFSGGNFTFEAWVKPTVAGPVYFQRTDANNYMLIDLQDGNTSASFKLVLTIVSGASTVVSLATSGALKYFYGFWHHIAVCESGDTWRLFVNGTLQKTATDTDRAANYTGTVYLGYNQNTSAYFTGKMDEIRVSNTNRYTTGFTPQVTPFGTNFTTCYVGSIRPLAGMKFYVGTANATAATMTVDYWDGSDWTSVSSLVDGTSATGKTMAQTGSVSFTSTVSVAKFKNINLKFLYWYRVILLSVDDSVTLTKVTLNIPFQAIKDIWDGRPRVIGNFLKYKTSTYKDHTIRVVEDSYDSGNNATFSDVGGITTSDCLYIGFLERMAGILFKFAEEKENTTANTTITISYWDGDEWTALITDDGTNIGDISFGKSGYVTWTAPAENTEFVRTIIREQPFYFYKIAFDQTLSANVYLHYISGIPAQTKITGYRYPMLADNRLWLLCNQDRYKNSAIYSAVDTSSVFNGADSGRVFFGDESPLTCGTSIYTRIGNEVASVKIFGKEKEVYSITGTGPEDYMKRKLDINDGVVAPNTLKTMIATFQDTIKPVAIWQGANGIYMFDNTSVVPIHADIRHFFDKNSSSPITSGMINDSYAFIDHERNEYHWLFATGAGQTTFNNEWVFDLYRSKWFEIDRGTGLDLQLGLSVRDTNGNDYTYGGIDTGYIERLDYGNTFDSTAISFEIQTGDMALLKDSIIHETLIEKLSLVCIAKTVTSNTITVTHYGNSSTTATTPTWSSVSPAHSGYRLAYPINSQNWGSYFFHSLKFTMSTSDETIGFEPIGIGGFFKTIRERLI